MAIIFSLTYTVPMQKPRTSLGEYFVAAVILITLVVVLVITFSRSGA